MTRKIGYSVLVGLFVVTLAGLASAGDYRQDSEYRGMNYLERPTQLPGADTEAESSNTVPWLEREPVETGAMPSGSPDLRCCDPSVDADGNTLIRPGIDDGPG